MAKLRLKFYIRGLRIAFNLRKVRNLSKQNVMNV